jgi:hypothetical protein
MPLVCLFLLLVPIATPQRSAQNHGPRPVFSEIQQGIATGAISSFSHHFHTQVHITLRGGESGLFSSNQAYYLLLNYFRPRKTTGFSFSTYGDSGNSPYATGGVVFNVRGARESAQVYVALSNIGGRWVITHINIY